MGKYAALRTYLMESGQDHIPMTFEEIETVVGHLLPSSKQYPAWWSNSSSNNVMTKEWLAAGYKTESVNTASEKLVFRKVFGSNPGSSSPPHEAGPVKTGSGRHPVFGCMAGTVTLAPGYDPTEPASPHWARMIDDKYGAS